MAVRWQDARLLVAGEPTDGLRVTVSGHVARPPTRLEFAARTQLRLVVGNVPAAYVRHHEWSEVAWLSRSTAPAVLGPITADDVRVVGVPARTGAWWRAWMTSHLAALDTSPRTPLFSGAWAFAPLSSGGADEGERYPTDPADGLAGPPPLAHGLARAAAGVAFARDDWTCGWSDVETPMGTIWPLRGPSPGDEGRLAWLRKLARDATLPPVLLLYVSALGSYVLLDGHVRLRAALAEGVSPPLLALFPARPDARGPLIVSLAEAASRLHHVAGVAAVAERLRQVTACEAVGARTRTWPMPGGRARFAEEVRSLAACTTVPPEDLAFLLDL